MRHSGARSFNRSITGRPCSNSPSDEQWIQMTRPVFCALAAASISALIFSKSPFLPSSHSLAFLFQGETSRNPILYSHKKI